ncbi:ammonium transporter [Altererythrobacter sp. MTPC7]|uniref:ammonium transporter n=1 Tax=Altererythrobacter sp. MTPC7 TaxID=3056567 RepID=UPI0036F34E04
MGRTLLAMALAALPAAASAQDPAGVLVADSGDTAWILTASALVLLMTLPGLGLFYAGLVRAKNVLSVLLQVAAIASVASVLWVVTGYTLAFGASAGGWIGNGIFWMFGNLGQVREGTTIPESTFALFQMTFAVITPALMVGAWVDRARFGWVVAFCALWGLVVYAPAVHWVWGGGWLAGLGTLDFAGGIVVHTTAGISALVIALLLGKREGFLKTAMLPHSPGLTMAGAALLWVGWFGFNGGSALTATDDASAAIINTHVAAATASLTWILLEKVKLGKATSVGWATGAIAGLATITPAAGFIGPGAAILLGLAGCLACYGCLQLVKFRLGIDDSLDVFAVHGVGGIVGSILLPLFLMPALGGLGYAEGYDFTSQLVAQLIGVGAVALWSAVATVILALMCSVVFPMRVSEEEERDGLDISSHGERDWIVD